MASLGPNEELIGVAGSRAGLATPALIVDLNALERNIAAMHRLYGDAGFALRPHAKTHKCSAIARLQIEAGALGVCCATLREAGAMVGGGVKGILVSSPVIGDIKIAGLVDLRRAGGDVMVVADNPANVRDLADAAAGAGVALPVLVDVDVGMQRTGVADTDDVVALARLIDGHGALEFAGIQGYSGRVQHIEDYAERARIYGAQLDHLKAVRDRLAAAGLSPQIISGGGTGTLAIDGARDLLTEHQAGSYLFMDVEYNAVAIFPDGAAPFETALIMQNSVISNNARGFVTIDGGFKCFATDGPVPEIASGAPEGAEYRYFGDEHGMISFAAPGQTLELGAKVELITPHCDPTVNLHDFYHCVRGETVVDIWPVDARGVL